jgi:hypothetical protein
MRLERALGRKKKQLKGFWEGGLFEFVFLHKTKAPNLGKIQK